MSENTVEKCETVIAKEGAELWKLPDPTFPTLNMPERPKTGDPEGTIHPACNGEKYEDISKKNDPSIQVPDDGMPRILIGVPILNYSHEFVESFLKFWTQICTQAKGKMQVGYYFMYRKPVHMAEIALAEIAIYNKCTHLLLMDDDIYDVTLNDLNKLIEADKDIISGVMHASKFPYAMCVFRRYDTTKKVIDMPSDNKLLRLYEVPCTCSECGFGISHWDARFCPSCGVEQNNIIQKADLVPFPFTLIKTSLFSKLKKPWFHCEIEYPSDSWFADRCIEAGIQEYAHMGVRLNHNGVTDASKPFMMQSEMDKKRKANDGGMIGLSEEEMARHQYILHDKMKEAELKLKPKPVMVTVGETEEVTK